MTEPEDTLRDILRGEVGPTAAAGGVLARITAGARARRRRRAAVVSGGVVAVLAVVAVSLIALDDPDDGRVATNVTSTQPVETSSTTSTTAAREPELGWLLPVEDVGAGLGDEPPLVVASGAEVLRVDGGVVHTLTTLPAGTAAYAAVGDGHGSVAIGREWDDDSNPPDLLLLTAEGLEVIDPGIEGAATTLFDCAFMSSATNVLYGIYEPGAEGGDVALKQLGPEGTTYFIAVASAPEYSVSTASIAAGTVVTSATADLTESISFYGLDGGEQDGYTPTDSIPYNMPPYLSDAVLSPDGGEFAYLSGPDWNGETQEPHVGRWEVVVADREGDERLRLPFAERDARITRLDFDGRWAVISMRSADDEPASPLLIDTLAAEPTGRLLSEVTGTVTIDVTVEG